MYAGEMHNWRADEKSKSEYKALAEGLQHFRVHH